MEVYGSMPMSLSRTGALPTYLYPEWATGTYYAANTIRRKTVSGVVRDYRAKYGHTSSTLSAPPNSYYWQDMGPASISGGWTYTTNVRLSFAATWATGTAIAIGDRRYDDATNHDYLAAVALTTAQNTTRPSECLVSTDELTRQRWVDAGAANAWAPLDYKINSRLVGYDTGGGVLASVVFSVDVETLTPINRVAVFGMRNVEYVQIKVYVAGVLTQTVTKQIDPADEDRFVGILPSCCAVEIDEVAAGAACYMIITLAQGPYTSPLEVGVIVAGYGASISSTHWRPELSHIAFSSINRDEVFGVTEFIKRGTARVIRAQGSFNPATVPPYAVDHLFQFHSGSTAVWDLNNDVGADPSLIFFGFARQPIRTPINHRYHVISLEIEGLVE